MILESGGREYGDDAGGFGAGVLQADPRMLRNEHHSSRMQIALLISNMSVDGPFLDQHDLILLKMRVGWYGCAGGQVPRREHQMLRAIGFRSDLKNESAGVDLTRLGPPKTRLAFIFFQKQWGRASLRGCVWLLLRRYGDQRQQQQRGEDGLISHANTVRRIHDPDQPRRSRTG